ncbi:uncharacterized protein LOC116033047 [Ipomoea triloba]|uniref:uncharacterized protein LOC116033047 n=1 Tax=Ipomoea triloba TaxID=35885 RepID=UPI00125CF38B|nr:uncharacterized protein LOC116033047 [Ipomoea triloba]
MHRRGGVLNGVAQSTHTTGSTPHVKVAAQLEGLLGHYPSYYELFKHTHTKQHDGQTFIVEKAKQIHEQVESQRELLTQNGEQVDDNQLYYDAVGGHDKKRRIYGLGSYGCSVVNGQSSDNTSCNMTPTFQPPDNATSTNVQDEIQSLKATILVMQQRLDAIDLMAGERVLHHHLHLKPIDFHVNKRLYEDRIEDGVVVEKVVRTMPMKYDYVVASITESHKTELLSVAELKCMIESHIDKIESKSEPLAEEALKSQVTLNMTGTNQRDGGSGRGRGRGR